MLLSHLDIVLHFRLDALQNLELKNAKPDISCIAEIPYSGLVLWFPYRSAKIEPLPATPFMAGSGGGWIAMGLALKDRF